MSTKRPKAGVGSTEATDRAGASRQLMGLGESWMVLRSRLAMKFLPGFLRELDHSSELSSSEKFARLLEREMDGSSESSSSEEFARLLERELDGSLVPSNSEEFARLIEIDIESAKKLMSHYKLYLVVDLDYTLLNSTYLNQMTVGEEYLRSQTDSLFFGSVTKLVALVSVAMFLT
ncbi:hypothetical protein EV1_025715 [Malus domestica]